MKLKDYSISKRIENYRNYAEKDLIASALNKVSNDVYSMLDYDNIIVSSISDRSGISFYNIFSIVDINIEHIKTLLTDGYLAFEVITGSSNIFKDEEEVIALEDIAPTSLVPRYRNNERVWVQNLDSENERELKGDKIIYCTYSDNEYTNDSYVGGLIRPYRILEVSENKVSKQDYDYLLSNFKSATRIVPKEEYSRSDTLSMRSKERYNNFINTVASKLLSVYETVYRHNVYTYNKNNRGNIEVELKFKKNGVFNKR